MNLPTLDWLVNQSSLTNMKCVASPEKLDKQISSVNVIDNPDVVKWIKRDELVLTTGFFFVDNPELQYRVLRDLKETDCAALCIKVKQYMYKIPEDMIGEAKRLGMVLIELPFFFPFSEISQLIYNQIYQMNLSAKTVETQKFDAIVDMCFEGASLDKITHEISNAFSISLLLTDKNNMCIAISLLPDNVYLLTMQDTIVLDINKFAGDKKHPANTEDCTLYVQHVVINGFEIPCLIKELPHYDGYLFVLLKNIAEADMHVQLITKSARIIAMEIKSNPINTLASRTYFDFLIDYLLRDETISKDEILRICNVYGFNYQKKRVCSVFMPYHFEDEQQRSQTLQYIRTTVKEALSRQLSCYCCYNNKMVVFFFMYQEKENNAKCVGTTIDCVKNVLIKTKDNFACPVSIGIGRSHSGLETIRNAFSDCQKSIALGMSLHLKSDYYSYNELFLSIVLSEMEKENVFKIFDDTVHPLVQCDQKNNSELIKTLDALLENKYNVVATARKLFLHRNTMANRIEKIESIIERDLSDSNDRIQITLGLCAYRLLLSDNPDDISARNLQ